MGILFLLIIAVVIINVHVYFSGKRSLMRPSYFITPLIIFSLIYIIKSGSEDYHAWFVFLLVFPVIASIFFTYVIIFIDGLFFKKNRK